MSPSQVEFGFDVESRRESKSLTDQVHGNTIIEVRDPDHAALLLKEKPPADGLFTRHPSVELSVFTADCLPILFFTEGNAVPLAALHSGWRGAMKGIATCALPLLGDLSRVHVVLGPCILPCCFEVRQDFVDAFKNAGHDPVPFLKERDGQLFFDLPAFVLEKQLDCIPRTQINLDHLRCTLCSEPQLPSYRREKGRDPRIRSWIRRA